MQYSYYIIHVCIYIYIYSYLDNTYIYIYIFMMMRLVQRSLQSKNTFGPVLLHLVAIELLLGGG